MIKFFRKIRLQLFSENKFSKYLIYAIGEILLVVIGILIALQIGNINEERKKREQGIILKQALKTELKADIELIKYDLKYIEKDLKTINSFAERLSNATADLDTLVQIVRHEYAITLVSVRELDKTTFKSLESTGTINLIGHDLANNVSQYYTDRDLTIDVINNNSDIYFNLLEPFMSKYPDDTYAIQGHLQENYWKSLDLSTLNGMFNGLLTARLINLNVRKSILIETIDKTQNLIDQLE